MPIGPGSIDATWWPERSRFGSPNRGEGPLEASEDQAASRELLRNVSLVVSRVEAELVGHHPHLRNVDADGPAPSTRNPSAGIQVSLRSECSMPLPALIRWSQNPDRRYRCSRANPGARGSPPHHDDLGLPMRVGETLARRSVSSLWTTGARRDGCCRVVVVAGRRSRAGRQPVRRRRELVAGAMHA